MTKKNKLTKHIELVAKGDLIPVRVGEHVIVGNGKYSVKDFLAAIKKAVPKAEAKKLLQYVGGEAGQILGGIGGEMLGRPDIGASLGRRVGVMAGGKASSLLGFGSYVKTNSISSQNCELPEGFQVPRFANVGKNPRIQKVECIGDILAPSSPTSFNVTSWVINPANAGAFPWLSTIATRWQRYRFHGLTFWVITACTDYSATTSLGRVAMATALNVNDSPFSSITEMMQADFSVMAKPSRNFVHSVECDPSQQAEAWLYVNAGASPSATEDARLYNMGRFQLATDGLSASTNDLIGTLFVSYDVEFQETFVSPDDAENTRALWGQFATDVTPETPFGDIAVQYQPPYGATYGSQVWGPIFRPIAGDTLFTLNVNRTSGTTYIIIVRVQFEVPAAVAAAKRLGDVPPGMSFDPGYLAIETVDDEVPTWLTQDSWCTVTDDGDPTYGFLTLLATLDAASFPSYAKDVGYNPYGPNGATLSANLVIPDAIVTNGGAFDYLTVTCVPLAVGVGYSFSPLFRQGEAERRGKYVRHQSAVPRHKAGGGVVQSHVSNVLRRDHGRATATHLATSGTPTLRRVVSASAMSKLVTDARPPGVHSEKEWRVISGGDGEKRDSRR